jgi:hypothetical protein
MKIQQLQTDQFRRELTQRQRRQSQLLSMQNQGAATMVLDLSQPITVPLDPISAPVEPFGEVRFYRLKILFSLLHVYLLVDLFIFVVNPILNVRCETKKSSL